MPVWEAEIVVDEALARRLLRQFPELEPGALRPLGYGWDYTIWVVDERYAFRFPRRQIGVPGTEQEIAVLPKLAPLLPVAVPTPLFVGRPTDEYPWPFFGSSLLPGRRSPSPPCTTRAAFRSRWTWPGSCAPCTRSSWTSRSRWTSTAGPT